MTVNARGEAINALIEGLQQIGVGMNRALLEMGFTMTARDEAIRLMVDQEPADTMDDDFAGCGQLLDAIPDDVLVRLAIERGALIKIEVGEDVTGIWARDVGGDDFNPDHKALYRLADQ